MEANAIQRDRPSGSWTRFSVLLATFALIGAVLLAGCGSDDQTEGLNGITRTPPTEVGNVQLPNENPKTNNRIAQLKGGDDGLMLIYFGYTGCPDVCPTTLADTRLALAELSPEQQQQVEVGMVTVDPERDTARVLNGYLGHFFDRDAFASFIPETAAQLSKAESVFGASHKLGEPDEDGAYDVDHTAQLFAVDSNGEVKVEWAFGTPADEMAADLKTLLNETSPAQDA
ncbi:MAG: SCO family protein [Solirubrobacterales bacterium]